MSLVTTDRVAPVAALVIVTSAPTITACDLSDTVPLIVPLDELLRNSDVVVVMAASTPENRKAIGARELDLLPPGALFINVSRAHLVDYAALAERLRDPARRLRAALDVFDVEPLPAAGDDPVAAALRGLDNVLLTPHIAGALGSERERLGALFVDEVERFIAGRPLQHVLAAATLHLQA